MDALRDRQAIHSYTAAPVSRSVIERLIGCAIFAPNTLPVQPCAFTVLLDPERIDSCAKRAGGWLLDNAPGAAFGQQMRELLDEPDFSIFYRAPALVIVSARSSGEGVDDCRLAAENIM